jgi:hypothetical protein
MSILQDDDQNMAGAVLDYVDEWAAGLGTVAFGMTVGALSHFTLLPDQGTDGLAGTADKMPLIGDVLPNEIMLFSSGTPETVVISIAAGLAFLMPLFILGTDGLREVFGMIADDEEVFDRPAGVLAGGLATVLPLAFLMFDVLNSAAAGSPTVQVLMVVLYGAGIGLAAKIEEL